MNSRVEQQPEVTRLRIALMQLGFILLMLYAISFYNYLLFHTLAEVITAVIALGIFTLAWNSRRFLNNNYYLFIGIAFLTIGAIDLVHAFTYKGIGIIQEAGNSNIATQLWLAGRYVMAVSFLAAPFFAGKKLNARIVFGGFFAAFFLVIFSIFYWKIFPVAYQDGIGLTPFKKISEYAIIASFLLALGIFRRKKKQFDPRAYKLLSLVLIFMIISELMFTLYVGVYDIFNLLGHLVRIVAYYISYLAIVELGLMKPYRTLFKELKDNEVTLREDIVKRETVEKERENLFKQLQTLTHEAQKRADEIDVVFNSLVESVLIYNTKGVVVNANVAAFESLGFSPNGSHYDDITKKIYPSKTGGNVTGGHQKTLYQRALAGEIVHGAQCVLKNAAGETRAALATAAPVICIGEVIGVVFAWHDVTEAKKMERAKDEFISLASHQLRTPLSSISLSIELLLRGIGGEVPPEQKEYLKEAFESAKRMTKLITNLLNVSRIEMGTFVIQSNPVDVREIANQIMHELAPQLKAKNITPTFAAGTEVPLVQSDENVMRIILENLMTNALRYTPPGGTVALTIEKNGDNVIVAVADTGCGIPKNEQRKIFNKSFRGSAAAEHSSEGAGLGLYLVKTLAQRCGCLIRFESSENRGTTFYISIPINKKAKEVTH